MKGAQVQALRREFKSLQIKDGQFVTSYCDGTTEINNKMWIYGEKIEDVIAMEKIKHSLVSKFDYVVYSIEEKT